jgi:hypothetical protein
MANGRGRQGGATRQTSDVADAIRETLVSPNVNDSNLEAANVVDTLDSLARAVRAGFKSLGTGDAGGELGAVEHLALQTKEAGERVADALTGAGLRVAAALSEIAEALQAVADKMPGG